MNTSIEMIEAEVNPSTNSRAISKELERFPVVLNICEVLFLK